jgi:hypothetical protein
MVRGHALYAVVNDIPLECPTTAVLDIETAVASGTAHNVVPTQTVYLVAIAGTVQHVSGTSALNIFGDLERCALRPGNGHSAHGWRDVLEPVVTGYRGKQLRRFFRGDATFALPGHRLALDGFNDVCARFYFS